MADQKTRTYMVDGVEKSFDFDAFKMVFKARADALGKTIKEFESELGDSVGVSGDAVHQWRFGRSAPGDIDIVCGIASYLSVEKEDLLHPVKEPSMERLTELQVEAVSNVYKEIVDFLKTFEKQAFFTCPNNRIVAGSPLMRYTITSEDYRRDIDSVVFPSGGDIACAGYEYVAHSLQKEWVALGSHPIFGELEEYIEGPLVDLWANRDADYWRENSFCLDGSPSPRDPVAQSALTLKMAHDIIRKYL